MIYADAFQALKDGDFHTAVPLLEKAARETRYTSDPINHAYTLALYHVGDKQRLADVAFDVGNSLSEADPASAMDYFQRSIWAGLDANRLRCIGEFFEKWAMPHRKPAEPQLQAHVRSRALNQVAHVVGCLSIDDRRTHYLKALVSSLRKQGIESTIFTTESSASWFFNSAGQPLSQSVQIDAEVFIASVEGDFEQRAGRIAGALRASGIDVAFFHAGLAEQITARVASMRPSLVQVSVAHDEEVDADLFDGHIHLFQNALQHKPFSGPAQWIPPVSDIEDRLKTADPVTLQSIGLESASSISATFGDLHHVSSREYVSVLCEILKRFPKHFHLFVGAGNVKTIRPHLHSEGVLPRVRFLGQVRDVAPLLEIIDVYLVSFPDVDPYSVLDPMGAGKPVVVLRRPDSPNNPAAEIVGIRELTARGSADFIDIADRLLRNPEFHAQQRNAVLDRFSAEFRPDRLGERYKAFLAVFQ